MKIVNKVKLIAIGGAASLMMACGGNNNQTVVTVDENGKEIKREVTGNAGGYTDTMVVIGAYGYNGSVYGGTAYKTIRLSDKSGKVFEYEVVVNTPGEESYVERKDIVIVEIKNNKVISTIKNLTQEKIKSEFMNGK